jgi:hypothetical protein
MAKKTRKREKLSAPTSDYSDAQGNVLTLRGSFTAGARREYAETLAGVSARAASTQEDAWQRAVELLFERLAVRWSIAPHGGAHPEGHRQAGAPIERQRELLARLRVASAEERTWVRDTLREHCAEWFPDVQAP